MSKENDEHEKRTLVRASSWQEIFQSPQDADKQYEEYLDRQRDEYSQNNEQFEESRSVDIGKNTDITVFKRNNGNQTTVQRLTNGNVVLSFADDNKVHNTEIIPEVGNIDHDWSNEKIQDMQASLKLRYKYEPDIKKRGQLVMVSTYIKGKPATQGWENLMLEHGNIPQRVGYRIFPEDMLNRAKHLLEGNK
jgi:hypothetical protein